MRPLDRWFAALLLTGLVPAFPHDLYLMPETFQPTPRTELRIVFQNGDDFPVGGFPSNPERLRHTQLLSLHGTAPFQNFKAEAAQTTATVRVDNAGLAILTAHTIPSLIELDPAKFTSYLEHENLTHVLQWRRAHGETGKPGKERYSKYAKSLIRAGRSDRLFSKRTGLTVEIIPEIDPYSIAPGGTLPILLLFRGAPAADVAIESAWLENGKTRMEVAGRTDRAGRLLIPIRAKGPHRFHAIKMERCAEPQIADWESFWASLTFAIPH